MGIDVGGTNTDAALVFTPAAPRTADNPEVVELLESWVAALAACGRGEEAEEMDRQLRRRRAMMQWQDHTGEWRHANLRGIVVPLFSLTQVQNTAVLTPVLSKLLSSARGRPRARS